VDHRKHTKLIKFNKFKDVTFVVVSIRMATLQHLAILNRKWRPIICIIKPDLNRTSKETTKALEVAQVQINLMAGNHIIIIIMHILVPLTLLLQVLLTTLMQVLQIGVHNNNNNKLSQIKCQRWKIL